MCNCGPRRLVPPPRHAATTTVPPGTTFTAPHSAKPKPLFEYVGHTALTVIGPGSGLRYRFDRPGARLAVDPRDRSALAAVPVLKQRDEAPQLSLV
jgi:hypothetical protein